MIKKLLILTSTSMALVVMGGKSSQAADDPCITALKAGQDACIQKCEAAFPKKDEKNAQDNCVIYVCKNPFSEAMRLSYCSAGCSYAIGKVMDACQAQEKGIKGGCRWFVGTDRHRDCLDMCASTAQTSHGLCPTTSTPIKP